MKGVLGDRSPVSLSLAASSCSCARNTLTETYLLNKFGIMISANRYDDVKDDSKLGMAVVAIKSECKWERDTSLSTFTTCSSGSLPPGSKPGSVRV